MKFVELHGNQVIDGNNTASNYRINNSKTITSRSFEYKTKIIGSTPDGHISCCSIKTFEQFLEMS